MTDSPYDIAGNNYHPMNYRDPASFSYDANGNVVERTTTTVVNAHGVEIDFDAALELMEDYIREQVHDDLAPCTHQEFFDAYCEAHIEFFCAEFELSKRNPVF